MRDREFYLRPHSSDTEVIGQIFIDLALNISKLDRFPDLEDFLKIARATSKRPLIIDGGANIGAASAAVGRSPVTFMTPWIRLAHP
jgi:hypothetical protein